MRSFHWRKGLASTVLCLVLLITGCQTAPSPYEQVQVESTQKNAPAAVAKDATQGSEFNAFFPEAEEGYDRVYTQEKKGFAQAKLKKEGTDLAMLSISDTSSLPNAAAKYADTTDTLAGYPMVEIGSTQTAILVAERYQVKVLSRDPSFSASDRQEWIQKFKLSELAQLDPS